MEKGNIKIVEIADFKNSEHVLDYVDNEMCIRDSHYVTHTFDTFDLRNHVDVEVIGKERLVVAPVGVTTQKRQTSFLQIGALVSTDGRYDQTFLDVYKRQGKNGARTCLCHKPCETRSNVRRTW